jgi:hypothetical protein
MSWDPTFTRKSPLFWPLEPAVERLGGFADWPTPSDLCDLFRSSELPVRFEPAAPKPRRARASAVERYDARIAVDRVVPTRARSWHDLLNALVWVTFPRAKLALHARQHRMISARLPTARTKEQDAVAMLDEGGVVVMQDAERASAVVFGHAIYEGLACDGPASVRGAAYVVPVEEVPQAPRARVELADVSLAALFERDAAHEIGRDDIESIVVARAPLEPQAQEMRSVTAVGVRRPVSWT